MEGPLEKKDQEHRNPVPAALTSPFIPPCPLQPRGTLPQTLLEPPGRVQRQLNPSGSWLISEKTWVPVSTWPRRVLALAQNGSEVGVRKSLIT